MIYTLGHIVGRQRRHLFRMIKMDVQHAFYSILLSQRDQLLAAFSLGNETWTHCELQLDLPAPPVGMGDMQ